VTRCVTRCEVARRHIRYRSNGSCGCAARQRQRHADDSQYRHGFLPTLPLRSLLRLWHSGPPGMPSRECSTPVTLFVRLCKGTMQGRIRTLTGHNLQAAYRRTGQNPRRPSTTQHPRVQFRFTPTRASCLKQVASRFSILRKKSLHGVSLHVGQAILARAPPRRYSSQSTCIRAKGLGLSNYAPESS
jgi:hypothetical protein